MCTNNKICLLGLLLLALNFGTITKATFLCSSFRLPVKSAVSLMLRGPHDSCNIKDHVDDTLPLIKRRVQEDGIQLLTIVADGGPDYNPNHLVNQFYWSKLFKLSGLHAMVIVTYCPGYSALNPAEHLWVPLTNSLVGVYLGDTLPNEATPPLKQTSLSA